MNSSAIRAAMVAAMLAGWPFVGSAAPSWQNISTDNGRRIELDRSTLKRDGNAVEAQSRVTLDRDLIDSRSGAAYRIIEAVTRYDCVTRSARTLRRTYKINDKETLREEEATALEFPVRSGTLDDRVLREVCRPPRESQAEVAQKANDAAQQLKAANETLLKKEQARPAPRATAVRAADVAPAAPAAAPAAASATPAAPIPAIRPNLKAEAEKTAGARAATAAAAPATPAPPASAAPSAPRQVQVPPGTVQTVRNPAPPSRPASPARHVAAKEKSPHWSYDGANGPENWAKIDPRNKLCATGTRQSPIDIRNGIKVDQEVIRFDYRPAPFRIVDNGHTVSVSLSDNRFMLTGKTYVLQDIHFHRPAEMLVNGQRHEMSIHLVHRAADGSLAVVAVLLERGVENPALQVLWNYMPLTQHQPLSPPGVSVNPARLLPEMRKYYSFMGSLTTPPCTEGVLWLVMQQPVQISTEQMRMFAQLYPYNARPAQATGDRLIKEDR